MIPGIILLRSGYQLKQDEHGRAMGRRAEQPYLQLFDEDERKARCITPRNDTMRRQLARLAKKGLLLEVGPSLYARPEYWEKLKQDKQAMHKIRGLAVLHPDWVFCGPSAALVHGLWVSYSRVAQTHVLVSSGVNTRTCQGIHRYKSSKPLQLSVVDGVRVTSVVQTVFDCLRCLSFPEGVAVADSYLRVSGRNRAELVDALLCQASPRQHGVDRALYAARLADGRSESGGESIARAMIYELGYAMPDLQVEIDDPLDGTAAYRADFLWTLPNGSRVAGELDGREKYTNPVMTDNRDMVDVLADERLRESRIGATGVVVARFSFSDVCNRRRFAKILDCYSIPRVSRPDQHALVGARAGLRYVHLPGALTVGKWNVGICLCHPVGLVGCA